MDIIEFEGKTYRLQGDAYYSNRVFPGWWGDASEGDTYTTEFESAALDDQGNRYEVVWQFEVVKGQEPEDLSDLDWSDVAFVRFVESAPDPDDDAEPSKAQQVYDHPSLRRYVPSEKSPHITALDEAGLLDNLTADQCAAVVILAQEAYRAGQRSQRAEKIDEDAVWIDGVGGIERQPDGTWRLTAPDASIAAAALGSLGGSVTSEAKAAAARRNANLPPKPGKLPRGRPRKTE